MRIDLDYGRQGLVVEIPSANVTVLSPRSIDGLPDEAAAFREAVRAPIGSLPLKDLVHAHERVTVVIADITRPLPSERLLPWLFAELAHVPAENFTIIVGNGSHRPATRAELAALVGPEVLARYRVVNHDARDPVALAPVGVLADGRTVLLNKEYVQAERRIVLGFIEPHFMAGFSGGYKGVFPAVADLDSIMHYHRAAVIGDPRSTWGVLEGNPTQEQIREGGALIPLDFCINLTLNRRHRITRFFCGDPLAAHAAGCRFARETAMVPCPRPFPIVVTTNGGYPLDQNLYQSVKGMSAAAQIVDPGGLILCAAECRDGFPDHGNFKKMLDEHDSPQAMLETIFSPGFRLFDQWQVQMLARVLLRARVGLFSLMPAEQVRRAHLEPVTDLSERIAEELTRLGPDVPIAVLPEGPLTIPYLT